MVFGKKQEIKRKSKEDRFKEVAGRRVHNILNQMRLLRNCANRGNYSYNDEQVKKIIRALREELNHVESEFKKKISKREFSL